MCPERNLVSVNPVELKTKLSIGNSSSLGIDLPTVNVFPWFAKLPTKTKHCLSLARRLELQADVFFTLCLGAPASSAVDQTYTLAWPLRGLKSKGTFLMYLHIAFFLSFNNRKY